MKASRLRFSRLWPSLLLTAAVFLLLPGPAASQSLTGTLIGSVRDQQGGAVPGAVVRVSSPALIGGPVEQRTGERGQIRFPVLSPGIYTIDITKAGFDPYHEDNLRIGAGATIELVTVLHPAGIAESVVVQAPGSRLEARHSGFGTRFGPDDLRTVPTRRSSMFDFIRAAPGISPTSPSSGTATSVSAFGSGVNANMFLIDGTNFTCPCIGIARSEPGIDFIHEIQVQSVGASAEFGNIQGAVINVVMKQGGDRVAADAASFWQTSGLTGQPVRLPIANAPGLESGYVRERFSDLTANVGGPVVRNRAWFFAGYQHLRDYDSQPGTDPRYPRQYEQDKVVAKITWKPAANWQVFHSFHDEFWVNPEQPTIARPFAATLRGTGSVPSMTLGHLTHTLSANTVWDLRVGRFMYSDENRPSTGDLTTAPRLDAVSRYQSGAPERFGSLTLGRTTAKATLSHFQPRLLRASHDWKLGGQIERGGHDIASVTPTGERFVVSNGLAVERIARPPSHVGGQFVSAAAFVSDAIAAGDRTTINAGVRVEHTRANSQDLRGVDLDGRETAAVIEGLGTLYTWNVVSPRLGVTTKVDGAGRTLLRASYGRFYQGVLTAEIDPFHPGAAPSTSTNLVTGAVRVDDPRLSLRLDPKIRAPHTDEYSVGIDRAIGGQLAVAVAYVHKNGRDVIGWSDVAGRYRDETRALADGRTIPVFALDTAQTPTSSRRFLLANQPDYAQKYRGVVVAVERRRAAGWQAFGSYTLSRAYGLLPSSGAVASGEQASTIGPGRTFGRDPNDLTNAWGRLPNDRPHILRVMGSADVPRTGFLVAANLQRFSGKPWAATTVIGVPQNLQQRILLEPRGARRLPAQTLLDLRLSRTIRSGSVGRIELLLDVLNLLDEGAEESIVSDVLTTPAVDRVPEFGQPNVFVDPRRAMLGVRINFGAQPGSSGTRRATRRDG